MATNRELLQRELARAGQITQSAVSGEGFDPRGGYGVLAAQLGTAAIGAFAQKRAKDKILAQEEQRNIALSKFTGLDLDLIGQLSPASRESAEQLALKSRFSQPEQATPQSPLGKLQADITAGLIPEDIGRQAIEKQTAQPKKTIETAQGLALLDERTGNIEPVNVKTAKQAERERAKQETMSFDVAGLSSVRDKVGVVSSKIDQILESPDLDFATGQSGIIARNISGTKSYGIAQDVKTVTANAAFQALQAMRDASKTGGALGQVSERELDLLEKSMGAVDPSLPDKQFRRNMKEVKLEFNKILKTGEKKFINLYGKSEFDKIKKAEEERKAAEAAAKKAEEERLAAEAAAAGKQSQPMGEIKFLGFE